MILHPRADVSINSLLSHIQMELLRVPYKVIAIGTPPPGVEPLALLPSNPRFAKSSVRKISTSGGGTGTTPTRAETSLGNHRLRYVIRLSLRFVSSYSSAVNCDLSGPAAYLGEDAKDGEDP